MKTKTIKLNYSDLFVYKTTTAVFPPKNERLPFSPDLLHTPLCMIHTPSGLGSAFSLELIMQCREKLVFAVVNPGFTELHFHVVPDKELVYVRT